MMEPQPPSRAPSPSSQPLSTVQFQSDVDDSQPQYDDSRDYFHCPIPTSDDHDFDPSPLMDGDGDDLIWMRRRRGGSESGAMMDGGRKRARVTGLGEGATRLDEALGESRGGIEVYGDVDVAALGQTMSTVNGVGVGFDLNEPVDYLGVGESLRGFFLDDVQLGLGGISAVQSKGKDVIYIESDDNDDVQILDDRKFSGSGLESALKADFGVELKLGMIGVGSLSEGRSGQRRYTREEKGKGILDGDWLSIAIENHKMAHSQRDETNGTGEGGIHLRNNVGWNEALGVLALGMVNENFEGCYLPDVNGIHLCEPEKFVNEEAIIDPLLPKLDLEPPEIGYEPPAVDPLLPLLSSEPPETGYEPPAVDLLDPALLNARIQANRRREERRINKEIAKDYANHIAHPQPLSAAESPKHEIQEISGPFSLAMQKILDYKQGKCWLRTQKRSFTIDWTPSRSQGCKLMTAKIPSLLDLSLNVLAKNAESVVSLEPVPDALKHRISQAACDCRKMDSHLLEILVSESPSEVYVKDCSWMTEEQFIRIFGVFDTKNLVVLQLDLCGQALTEYTLRTTLAQSKNGLPALANLSLKSACRLTDNGLASIVKSAQSLQSINLSQCSLLTSCGISTLASCIGSLLKEFYIDDCQNIDAMDMLPALAKFERLEVLSVSGIHTVSDEFVHQFICFCGPKLKEIGLANCQKLTDSSLKAIGKACPGLCALDISNLDKLTDATVEYIANGCRSIQRLKFCRNSFSDEAVASFLEVSGQSLKELSLNHISKVGSYTALSLAKHSRSLLNLDLSWCRKLTDAAVGLVVDSCLSLRLLKLFGCTQITEVFLNGHSNPNVEIIGLNNMPVLKQLSAVDTHPGPLRYSPLITT